MPNDMPRAPVPVMPEDGAALVIDRRRLLSGAIAAGGGLLVGLAVPGSAEAGGLQAGLFQRGGRGARTAPASSAVTVWIAVGTDESVTIQVGSSELGQGAMSGLCQIVAEELVCPWANVRPAAAPADAVFGNPGFGYFQATGGSMSIAGYFSELLVVGAAAREMLVSAAAAFWGVPVGSCKAAAGVVTLTGTGKSLSYGALASAAALLPVPTNPVLLSSQRGFQLVGTSVPRPDIPLKVNGSAGYGIDTAMTGLLYAAIRHPRVAGSTLVSAGPVPAGALAVVACGNAVGVVASSTWAAFKAAGALKPSWKAPANASKLNSAAFLAQAQALMTSGPAVVAEQVGNVATALAGAAKVLTLTYSVPYVAHATLEPMNCTAYVKPGSCEIWAPTQVQGSVVAAAAALLGISASAVTVHTTFLGGGLGRRLEVDFVIQAIQISKAVGAPVKLTWSREEDFGNDVYRPFALAQITAGLDGKGNIVAWWHRTVTPSIAVQRGQSVSGEDPGIAEGALGQPYAFGSRLVDYVVHPSPIPIGYWRSVGHSYNAFFVESAIDECAAAAGMDGVAYRQRLLASNGPALAVLNAAASLGGWGSALPAGQARGVAFHQAMGSMVAEVVQIGPSKSTRDKTPQILSVACAIDCGRAVNPDSVAAQMQGGIVHGLNAALWSQVKFSGGTASVQNFDQYRMLRLREMPVVSVQIVSQGSPIGGAGEPGVPPIAPAVANAYFAMTGTRLRALPLF